MTRLDDELPTLDIPWPRCGHCGNDVQLDDSIPTCETCCVQWDAIEDGLGSEPDLNLTDAQLPCEREVPPLREYEYNGRWVTVAYLPCILPGIHTGECLNPYDRLQKELPA